MKNQTLLTPYFLDDEVPGLLPLLKEDWRVTSVQLPASNAISSQHQPAERQARMSLIYQPLRDAVASVATRGQRPVSIAGDCCTTLAVFAGLQHAGLSPTLFWFDAHGDFNTWQTTPSGFLGGMPLAMLVGRGEQTLALSLDLRPVREGDVWLSDGRDLDPGERLALEESNVQLVEDLADLLVMELPDGPYYVHFDCDILDPSEAPAMNYPAPGGPSSDLLRQVFRRLAASGQVAAVSLSAWNPEMAGARDTGKLVMGLLEELTA
ncbi:MAG: arginase family protein [Chloroflexota bacterium]|jgi:arginase